MVTSAWPVAPAPQTIQMNVWCCLARATNTLNVDAHRDKELAKFEAFLNKEECMNISALVRGRSRMAYPIKG